MLTGALLWQAPHRPMFLLAGFWAFAAPAVWLLPESFGLNRAVWHSRELLFGMGGAAVGGYLLTAMPAWTKRGPVSPLASVTITILWFAARFTAFFGDYLPMAVRLVAVSTYFAGLAAILGYNLVSARAWNRSWTIIGPIGLGGAVILSTSGYSAETATEIVSTVPMLFAVLIILIGGRAVPAFTRRWLERTGASASVGDWPALSYAAIIVILMAGGLGANEQEIAKGLLLILSAILLLGRTMGWRSVKAMRYPALFLLHAAWLWTPAGLWLAGLASIFPDQILSSSALHAQAMGAMGTMILSFMMRPAMVRRGDRLIVSRTMAGAFVLVWLAALIRVSASWLPVMSADPVVLAAGCWIAGWALFLRAYLPALRGPVPRPVFSAASRMKLV